MTDTRKEQVVAGAPTPNLDLQLKQLCIKQDFARRYGDCDAIECSTLARTSGQVDRGEIRRKFVRLSAGASGLRTRGRIRASFTTDARRQFQGTAFYHETARQ